MQLPSLPVWKSAAAQTWECL